MRYLDSPWLWPSPTSECGHVTEPKQGADLPSPHEYRHTLGTILNCMAGNDFILLGLWERKEKEENPQPGSWAHYAQVIPPWFSTFWRLEKLV